MATSNGECRDASLGGYCGRHPSSVATQYQAPAAMRAPQGHGAPMCMAHVRDEEAEFSAAVAARCAAAELHARSARRAEARSASCCRLSEPQCGQYQLGLPVLIDAHGVPPTPRLKGCQSLAVGKRYSQGCISHGLGVCNLTESGGSSCPTASRGADPRALKCVRQRQRQRTRTLRAQQKGADRRQPSASERAHRCRAPIHDDAAH